MTAETSVSELGSRADHVPGFRGISMIEAELCDPLPAVGSADRHQRLWVLVRLRTEPLGTCLIDLGTRELSPAQLGEILWRELHNVIVNRFVTAGVPPPSSLSGAGLDVDRERWPFLQRRAQILNTAPHISVIVCTRDRPDRLQACLQHLQRQRYPRYEVVVVDNSSDTDADTGRSIVAALNDPRYRCVTEPRVGLSRARNAGVAAASGEILAFLDDDEEPDVFWLAALAAGFARGRDVGCVTGLILPACLDSDAQVLFEELGGHSKDRGFTAAIFSAHGPQSPLYPRPPFGAGGNMAFRREALTKIGPFDTALGAGTPARGAEDTLALTLVLLAGYRIAYEPAAFVRHYHYSDLDGLVRQLSGYSLGLTAFYTALIRRRPAIIIDLLRLIPCAIRHLKFSGISPSTADRDLVRQMSQRGHRAMIGGPVAYLKGLIQDGRHDVRQARRTGKPTAGKSDA